MREALALSLTLLALCLASTAAGAAIPGRSERIQLYGNGNRGIAYLPLATRSSPDGSVRLVPRLVQTIQLDGDPLQNVYASLKPIDADGDGRFGFVHFNGTRFIQLWSASGRKLWRAENPDGYLHDVTAGTHRDTAAILDLDNDGGQDIAHCWTENGIRSLVYRRGLDGKVLRRVPLEGDLECEIAAFRMVGRNRPLVLVATTSSSRPPCGSDFVGYWARTEAYDIRLNRIWTREPATPATLLGPSTRTATAQRTPSSLASTSCGQAAR